ncbi:threonine/serine exporter family protein [Romboutsia sp.]|uniref:threonine/serine exporter family protein n=1 Tax=Romboutsia sp. TaxID=1965302 RepID=UPI003F3D22AD
MNKKQCEEFLEAVLNIGKLMIQFGAEISRVEDAFLRICKAYNISKVEIHAITTLIVSTIKTEEGIISTQSVRVGRTSNNLGALEALNALSRNICNTTPKIEEIPKMTNKAIASVKMSYYNCIGYVISAGAFAVFFGGSWLDGIVSAIVGGIVYLMDKFFKVEDDSKLIWTMIMSFIAGSISILLVKLGIGHNIDKVIIGVAMLFIPSLALINGVKDMFYRNIISGLFRVIEAVLVGATIATGFGLAIATWGGIL